ncbi:MAG: HAD family hydrolase [Promethearchaeota archaeon]
MSFGAVKAMVFDLDGTLVNIPNIWEFFDELLVQTLSELNIDLPPAKNRLEVWHSGGEFEKVIRSWGVTDYPTFIQRFDEVDYQKRETMIQSGEIRLFEDVIALETLSKRFKLALLTNTPPDIAWLEVKSFHLEHLFDVLVMLGTVEQEIAKPAPDGFFRCLTQLGIQPEEAVMIGDSSSDIIGGNQVGMLTVLINRPNQEIPVNFDPPPDLIITDLNELTRFRSS